MSKNALSDVNYQGGGLKFMDSSIQHDNVYQLTNERSEQFSSRSCKRKELPCASSESLSISPNRMPPALFLPCTG